MRIVLDENLPKPLKAIFPGHEVSTVQELGLAGVTNGELLKLLEEDFDLFITADKNLRYQQNLAHRTVAILELPTNRLPLLEPLFGQIAAEATRIRPGDYCTLRV
jgi:predicted nuclease of predicted toxin-antitoxin system